MIEFFAGLVLSGALAVADDIEIKELSSDFYNLELAQFEKKLPVLERHERQAERIAKKANCKLPSDIGWVHARVDMALEVSPQDELPALFRSTLVVGSSKHMSSSI
ncbi:hypothetical protein [Parasphingorhabdus halotolerans]|uniref:Uncharacterized protein n=1 Tax=Parasphingorhabdus halotolerans TaxID=2725558 RepID=A0A6H2DM43_9SPHN|nr:hypothetical protein [Parasphingorhabdus halotolerans]QJB69450.1 hypothetical protein HF685_09280 [Parasphingorhabdus halotolerans]